MQIVFYTDGNQVLKLSVRNDAVPTRQYKSVRIYYCKFLQYQYKR